MYEGCCGLLMMNCSARSWQCFRICHGELRTLGFGSMLCYLLGSLP